MTVFKHTGNLKGLLVTRVLRLWPSHFQQFGSYITKVSDEDRDILLIVDPKVVQAAAEEVSIRQLGIQQGSVLEANSKAIDVSTFKDKADISSAFSLLEEAKMILDDLESDQAVRKLRKQLHRASRSPSMLPGIMPRWHLLPTLASGMPA